MFHSFITFEEEILHQASVITTIPLEKNANLSIHFPKVALTFNVCVFIQNNHLHNLKLQSEGIG